MLLTGDDELSHAALGPRWTGQAGLDRTAADATAAAETCQLLVRHRGHHGPRDAGLEWHRPAA